MSYWKAIQSQAVDIAAFVLKLYEEEATDTVFTAPFFRERERESKLINKNSTIKYCTVYKEMSLLAKVTSELVQYRQQARLKLKCIYYRV